MEMQKSCTGRTIFWTPVPIHTSPKNSFPSEDVWEDEDEEQAQKDYDFASQMDENGIIGLSEILEGLKSGVTYNTEFHPTHEPLTPEDTDLSPEELNINSSGKDLIDCLKTQTMDEEESRRKEEQGVRCFPGRNKYLEMAEEQRDAQLGKRSNRKQIKREHCSISKRTMTRNCLAEGDTELMNSTYPCSSQLPLFEPPGDSNRHCPTFQPASPATDTEVLPHFLLSAEVIPAPGIETEAIPDMSLVESLSETHKSHMRSSPHSSQPAAMFSEEVVSDHYGRVTHGSHESDKDCEQHTLSPRKTRQQSPEGACSPCSFSTDSSGRETKSTRSKTSGVGVYGKGRLSNRPPDFSKVKARVNAPKGVYKPPKSKMSFKKDSCSPEPPLMFKSPADIVKEVLLNMPPTSESSRSSANALNSTVPKEFRSRQQATMLLEQLQENYNSLLIKYAEAENTIDRLRLEAKMNMYSDPPKSGHLVQSGRRKEASNFMVLDFPQAQRAVNSSACHRSGKGCSHPDGSSVCPLKRRPDSLVKQQPAKALYNQAARLLHQLQTFESLLKCRNLKPFEELEGLSQLSDGLQYLERGYLLAKDEHKLLVQQQKESSPFDPERELEGLIFQCGLHMDELKEHVRQTRQAQPTCDTLPSSPPDFSPSSVPLEQGDSLTRPEVDPGEATVVEMRSASEESNGEIDHEETGNSLYLKSMNGKHRNTKESAMLSKDCQNPKDLSKPLDPNLRDEKEEEQSQETTNLEVQNSLLQSDRKSELEDSPHSKQQSRRSSSRKIEVGKSHSSSLSSLGEITIERKSSKCLTSRVPSQDGIISPEIDSGFVGSESSHLTHSATPSPHHQRPPESVPATQEGNSGKPHAGLVPSTLPPSSPSHSPTTAIESSMDCQLNTDVLKRSRHGQRRYISSQQRCFSQRDRSTTSSGASEFVMESDSAPTVSEEPYTDSINSLRSAGQRSSPTSRHQRGDSSRAPSSGPVLNVAIQTLQAEVNNLQEKLERCLKNKKPVSSDAACPSAQGSFTHHRTSISCIRSMERWDDVSRSKREDEESVVKRTVRMRPSYDHRQKPRSDIPASSEPTKPQTVRLGCKCAQPSATATDSPCSCTNTVSNKTHPRKCPGVTVQVCDTADEPDSRSRQAVLCPQLLSYQPVRPEAGGNKEQTQSSPCHRCVLCGCPEPECCRVAHSTRQKSQTPAELAAAAPPALLQYMPVCSLPVLLHTSSLYLSTNTSSSVSAEVDIGEDVERRLRRQLSGDEQRSVDSSLKKAIRAARHMKLTSSHMARSLAVGLHYRHQLNTLHELHR